jgi:hypothetical protein
MGSFHEKLFSFARGVKQNYYSLAVQQNYHNDLWQDKQHAWKTEEVYITFSFGRNKYKIRKHPHTHWFFQSHHEKIKKKRMH